MSSLSGVGLLTSFGDRRDLVPVALRAAAGPGLCLLCCGRRADRRSGQAARRTTPQSCLRARLLDHVRNPGGERDNHRSTAPFLSPGGESGRRGIVLLLGAFMMGLVKLSWLQREFRLYLNVGGGRPVAAYIIGVAFAFGWTPCIGPVLGAILTTSAAAATVPQGIILLGFYSLGLGLPFLAAAVFSDSLMLRLRALRRLGRNLQLGAGAVVAGMGIAILTGELTSFSYWLLDTFPILARIG